VFGHSGINDAPILSKEDVGVAMGKGTDVAREAASIVIVDDNFAMVPYALAEGRRLLDNLRKALAFYLGVKLGLICLFIVGTLWQRYNSELVLGNRTTLQGTSLCRRASWSI
jgi:Ca2+-transporting ATPase